MNNLYTEVENSIGFTRGISLVEERFPFKLNDILLKPNDLLTGDNFNYALSGLYENLLSIASDSYIYSPNIPITNPFSDENETVVGTLCGTFVPSYSAFSGITSANYYLMGVPHLVSAFPVIYNTHDLTIQGDYLTYAVGLLSATNLTTDLENNVYENVLSIINYPLSSILEQPAPTYNSVFSNQTNLSSTYIPDVIPNYVITSKYLNNKSNLKFTSISKLKFFNNYLYALDSESTRLLQYDLDNLLTNRKTTDLFEASYKTVGFSLKTRQENSKIKTFCVNANFVVFYNYLRDGISVYNSSLNHLYDFTEAQISVDGERTPYVFADMEFDTEGDLYILTTTGEVFVYSVTNTKITFKKKLENVTKYSVIEYTKILFSKSDKNVFYVATSNYIFKRFKSTNAQIGQFNTGVCNNAYFSTLSSVSDNFNTLIFPDYTASFDSYLTPALKYTLNSINSLSYNNSELFSVCFTDNCTYQLQADNILIRNLSAGAALGPLSFIDAVSIYGMNPISASGITVVVDAPNYLNLNNDTLNNVKVYTFDEISVKGDEFVTDFTINKAFRKLLYNIFNYQTYLCFKPVIDVDVNKNPVYKRLDYILSYDKDQNFTNFDNFIGLNEITSTVFLNRCFTKVYNLLASMQANINPTLLNTFPRYTDTVTLLNDPGEIKFTSEYYPFLQSGTLTKEQAPISNSVCPPSPYIPGWVTPNGNVCYSTINHVATVTLSNNQKTPAPVGPFSGDNKPLSAVYVYNPNNNTTLVSQFSGFFNQSAFSTAVASVNGDYEKLIGRTFSDYTLINYIPASNTVYKTGGRGETSDFDVPAQVVWSGDLTSSVTESFPTLIKVIEESNIPINISNNYIDRGISSFSSSTAPYFTTNLPVFSITTSQLIGNKDKFFWYLSAYAGVTNGSTAVYSTCYFNNYTPYDVTLTINNSNTNLSPFYLNGFPETGPSTQDIEIDIPATSQNYPIPVWVDISSSSSTKSFNSIVDLNGYSVTINGTATWTQP